MRNLLTRNLPHLLLPKWDSDPNDFVQIINVSGQHWVCASNMNCPPGVVDVYDSIPAYSIGSQSLHLQLAAILRTQFHIHFMDVQCQSGGSDCGLFAIANATALCGGLDPHLQNFEQSKMREHLKKCFLENRLEFFPESQRRLGQHRFVATKPVDVFCTCRLTWNQVQNQLGDLIQCEICKKWYHEVSEGVDRTRFEHPKDHWYCTKCFKYIHIAFKPVYTVHFYF